MTRSKLAFDLGAEIRRRREAKGMTLEMLAERSGLTSGYIGTIENGLRDPSISTMQALATALGVPLPEFLGGSGEISWSTVEAAQLFELMQPEVQAAIMKLLSSGTGSAKTPPPR